MKKKIIFTTLWTVGFSLVYLLFSMVMFAILGLTGFQKTHPSDKIALLLGIWAWLFWASPAVALVLSIFGLLPGTRAKAGMQTT